MNNRYRVAGIGELLWDLLPTGKQLGGAPLNFAYHAMQAGCESFIVSALGKDPLGEEIFGKIKQLGMDYRYIQKNDFPTGTVVVHMNEQGQHSFEIVKKVAWDHIQPDDKLKELAGSLDAVCFGSLAQRNEVSAFTIKSLVRSVRPECLKVFDINLRQNFFTWETIKESLEIADVLKLNDEEIQVVADFFGLKGDTPELLPQLIDRFNLKCIAFTMGKKGSIIMTTDEFSSMEAPEVRIADTIGAGDAFTALLTVGLLKGDPLSAIHKRANMVAAYVCTREGATPVIPAELFI